MLKNLKNLRKEIGLTQKQVAEKLNISQQTYSDYENCKTEPTSEILIEIATFFEVSVDELLGREETIVTEADRAAGWVEKVKISVTPLEADMLEAFRKVGKKYGESVQRAFVSLAEKMCD